MKGRTGAEPWTLSAAYERCRQLHARYGAYYLATRLLPAWKRRLGLAFQLTNFIRDVAEDLARGRVDLPAEDLDRFGVGRADLAPAPAGPAVQGLLAFEVDRARAHYRAAAGGIELLAPPPGPVSGSPSTCMPASWMRSSGSATRS